MSFVTIVYPGCVDSIMDSFNTNTMLKTFRTQVNKVFRYDDFWHTPLGRIRKLMQNLSVNWHHQQVVNGKTLFPVVYNSGDNFVRWELSIAY
ncbi:hypothetical protein IJ00_18170 [Calothrix sp. 336/3]|nr:hypothetical protein IJ00_18170 [Calothrix sp. 336/3]